MEDRLLADLPTYPGGDGDIPNGADITVHFTLKGQRFQFDSVLEAGNRLVTLNVRQQVVGIALRKPTAIADSQRRSFLRVSLLGYDPINVYIVTPHPDIPDVCALDAKVVTGRAMDISSGGMSILVERDTGRSIQIGGRFFLSFALPSVEAEFQLLGLIRHNREVKRSESLRLGVAFRQWRGPMFTQDQRRIARFITKHERRMLKRRK